MFVFIGQKGGHYELKRPSVVAQVIDRFIFKTLTKMFRYNGAASHGCHLNTEH